MSRFESKNSFRIWLALGQFSRKNFAQAILFSRIENPDQKHSDSGDIPIPYGSYILESFQNSALVEEAELHPSGCNW